MQPSSPFPPNSVAFSVDVEDYFMSPECIRFEDWEQYPSAIHEGMENCLNLLKEYNAKATFFFVGWLAERYPEIVKWTVEQGHEIGTHTYTHKFISSMDAEEFQSSLQKSIHVLKTIAPEQEIIGHRAPAFSLDRKKTWQFDILQQNGIRYDSSINPHQTYLYGDADASRFPYQIEKIIEIPPSVIELTGKRFPVGGGGTLRILPECYLRFARRRFVCEGYPAVVYMHPWEFVPNHPKLKLPLKLQIVHSFGLKSVERKMRSLLEQYTIITMREYYEMIVKSKLK